MRLCAEQFQAGFAHAVPVQFGRRFLQRREGREHPVGEVHHRPVGAILGAEADGSGEKHAAIGGLLRHAVVDALRDVGRGGPVFLHAEAPGGVHQRPGDQHVAVGRVVRVGDVRLRVGFPAPCGKPVVADQELRLGPHPQAVKALRVAGKGGEQHAVALALAVADRAVGVVDHAPLGRDEPLLEILPELRRQRRARERGRRVPPGRARAPAAAGSSPPSPASAIAFPEPPPECRSRSGSSAQGSPRPARRPRAPGSEWRAASQQARRRRCCRRRASSPRRRRRRRARLPPSACPAEARAASFASVPDAPHEQPGRRAEQAARGDERQHVIGDVEGEPACRDEAQVPEGQVLRGDEIAGAADGGGDRIVVGVESDGLAEDPVAPAPGRRSPRRRRRGARRSAR